MVGFFLLRDYLSLIMPLIVMCGLPCSGKTTRAKELEKFFLEKDLKVHVIGDHCLGIDKNEVYADSRKEKELRGNLKSETQRKVTKEDVVILDSPNYIKGFRYELFCVIKSARTPHCIVQCDISQDRAVEWNQKREENEQYVAEILDGLFMRFEPPIEQNRWDSPLFLLQHDDSTPCEAINDALFSRKAPPANQATQNQPLSATNFLHELDNSTQAVVKAIMAEQKMAGPGDSLTIPDSTEKLILVKHLNLAELQRYRRQFISFTKSHPPEDTSKIANMFVQFLNNTLM